ASIMLERNGIRFQADVPRANLPATTGRQHPATERYDDGGYYVDLAQVTMSQLDATMANLAVAPGVIFDIRRRPNGNEQILSHLLTRADRTQWMAIPRIIRPDSPASPAAWKRGGWALHALAPHIQGKVVFFTGPSVISYPESIAGLAEYYRL